MTRKTYFALSPLVQSLDKESQQAFWKRWEKITQIPFLPGTNLRELIQMLFPNHFKRIEVGQQLASELLQYQVGPMSALYLLGPCLRNHYVRYQTVSAVTEILMRVGEWIRDYHVNAVDDS